MGGVDIYLVSRTSKHWQVHLLLIQVIVIVIAAKVKIKMTFR